MVNRKHNAVTEITTMDGDSTTMEQQIQQQIQLLAESIKAMQEKNEAVQEKHDRELKEMNEQFNTRMSTVLGAVQAVKEVNRREPTPPILERPKDPEVTILDGTRSSDSGIPLPYTRTYENGEPSQLQKGFGLPVPKIEIQFFKGENPRGWLRKWCKYFLLYKVPENQMVDVASMYLDDVAESWYAGAIAGGRVLNWEDFCEELCLQFCGKGYTDIVDDFNKLKQVDTVGKYQEEFQELRCLMLMNNPTLSESYFISSFISGLKPALKSYIKINEPQSLQKAFAVAKQLEGHFLEVLKETKSALPSYQRIATSPPDPKYSNPTPNRGFGPEVKKIPGACYRCGERYYPGHQCQQKTLNYVEAVEELLEEGAHLNESGANEINEGLEVDVGVSMNALCAEFDCSTITIEGEVKSRRIKVLLDTGSTNSFIGVEIARLTEAHVNKTSALVVTVANGHKMLTREQCRKYEWWMQNLKFTADLRILRLKGCDVILGVDWLKTVSPVTFDYGKMQLSFYKDGKRIWLQGITRDTAQLKLTSTNKNKMQGMLQTQTGGTVAQIFAMEANEVPIPNEGLMDKSFSSDSTLAWLWLLEYLASIPEIEPSNLRDLINATPVLLDELPKNTREMVALGCLAYLVDQSALEKEKDEVLQVTHLYAALLKESIQQVNASYRRGQISADSAGLNPFPVRIDGNVDDKQMLADKHLSYFKSAKSNLASENVAVIHEDQGCVDSSIVLSSHVKRLKHDPFCATQSVEQISMAPHEIAMDKDSSLGERWTNLPNEDATWRGYSFMFSQFPYCKSILEDKNSFNPGELL